MSTSLNLALQGGGAHGAYTWGVLDRLLDESALTIEGISGTSAGAMNAAVVADGMTQGGRSQARRNLEAFWHAIAEAGYFSPFQPTWFEKQAGRWNLDHSPAFQWYQVMSLFLSPYQTNPLDINPLRRILETTLDLAAVHACERLKIFAAATRVRDGHPVVFQNADVTVDALLASACLPHLYKAIEIEGESYWDGGFTGNPAIWPLIYRCASPDVLVVQINPLCREDVPDTAAEIVNRMNEITFNASLVAEMRAIRFVQQLIHDGCLDEDTGHKAMHIHMIQRPEAMQQLNASSKFNTSREFLTYLRDLGRTAAETWLRAHRDAVGRRSSVDIYDEFLQPCYRHSA